MKLAACVKKTYTLLLKLVNEGIVAALRRQLNQILLRSACFVFQYNEISKELSYVE